MEAKKTFLLVSLIILIAIICSTAIAAMPAQIEEAIGNGVAWLAAQQNPETGYWQDSSGNVAATTGFALTKLQERAFELGYTPFDPCYPYKENVEKGLAYLFSQMSIIEISTQPAGNPDSDGDGNGVFVNAGHLTYETGIALMAIATSRAPDRVVNSPGSQVDGWTYRQVLVDMVDYMAFGQVDSGGGRGGWGYAHNEGWADNSNSGYAVLGLGYAASPLYGFNCTVPQFVKDELNLWIDYIQTDGGPDDGSSGYSSPGYVDNTLKTGNLIFEMTFAGRTPDDPGLQRAKAYIERTWNDPSRDPGWGNPAYGGSPHCQAMFCIMKGLEYADIDTIVVDGDERDWYADFADALVNAQDPCGFWPDDLYGGNTLASEWALLTLEKLAPLCRLELTKFDDVNDGDCVGPADEITYTICYHYIGDENCPDINEATIVDYLPAGVEFISASGSWSRDSNTVTWNIGTLEPGESNCVTMTVRVRPCVEPGSIITNCCEMKSSGWTLGSACEDTSVCRPIITKVDDVNSCVGLGDFITYNICYAANGYGDTNVLITDFLPDEVNYVSSDPCGFYAPGSPRTVAWYIGNLPSDACGCIELVVQVNTKAEFGGAITNRCEMNTDCIYDINNCESTCVCWPYAYIIYVDANATGANNGTSWRDAFINLQDAVEKLLLSCSTPTYVEVRVAAGTYKPDCNSASPDGSGDRNATFNLMNNVAIYGGFPRGGGPWEARNPSYPNNKTILSGDIGIIGKDNDNTFHVVTANSVDETAVLDGFTVTGGNASDYGGGLYNNSGSPTITSCTFTGNSSYYCGGGMYNSGSSTITDCTFSGNWANYGGGMYNSSSSTPTITDSTLSGNWAYYGSGIYNESSSPTITNCTFGGNWACYYGGGMYNDYYSGPTITNCTFSGNWASYDGGGIYNYYSYAGEPTITNCAFSDNSAERYGGGLCNYSGGKITNCTFSGNIAMGGFREGSRGGGMYNISNLTITNCMFTGNSAYGYYGYGGGMYNSGGPTITNCTFSGNSAYGDSEGNGGGIYNDYGAAMITNCMFTGNSAYGYYSSGGGMSIWSGSATVANCIFWGDMASDGNEIALFYSTAGIDYSDVKGGQAAVYIEYGTLNWGTGNIDADPCFVEPGYWGDIGDPNKHVEPDDPNATWLEGNHRLLLGSPCIDAGDNNSVPPDYADLDRDSDANEPTPLDLDGFPRFIDGYCSDSNIVDMGAYEFLPGDINHNGFVNFIDFSLFASQWFQSSCGECCGAELTCDGQVNWADLREFAKWWLAGTAP